MATMKNYWWRLLIMIAWSLCAEGSYHLRSMQRLLRPLNSSDDSLFGWGIAYQRATNRLIVSAPNIGIGKIYDCSLDKKDCLEFKNSISANYLSLYGKMWMGATVASGENFTMACAPRYIEPDDGSAYSIAYGKTIESKTGTFGKCFVASHSTYNMTVMKSITIDDKLKEEFKPTKKTDGKKFEEFMDSFGWSLDVTHAESILVGGPAMYKGRAIVYSSVDEHPKLIQDTDKRINFNFGYSVTSGNFQSANKEEVVYAISSPYGRIGLGLVLMHSGSVPWYLPQPKSHPPRVGAMYGAAMAAAQLFPGKAQSLLVGAPTYAEQNQMDMGAVYIYQADDERRINPWKTIVGKVNGSRFGSAILSLGDLNGDDSHEIAIGAPYEDLGAVYIYSGAHLVSRDEAELTHIQKIKPGPPFRTFGFSLAALMDYANNGFNELAISAPESSEVLLFSRMSTIILQVSPLQEKVILPKYPRARRNDTHFVFESCIDIKYPEKPTTIYAEFQLKVSITHASATLIQSKDEDGSLTHKINIVDRKKTRICVDVEIIMPEVGRDRMIQYDIVVTQLNSPKDQDSFNASHLYLSDLSSLVVSDTVWVADCEGQRECQPKFEKITILTTMSKNYTIGSSSTEKVSVSALNSGDMAYSACLRVRINGAQVLRYPAMCAQLDQEELECQPRLPVKKNSYWQTEEIELDMKEVKSDIKEISFDVDIFPACQKHNSSRTSLTIPTHPDPRPLILRGSTNVGDTVEITAVELEETGKQMSHEYTVYNFGVSDWINIQCEITLHKEPFYEDFDLHIESAAYQCKPSVETKGDKKIVCIIEELKKQQKFTILLPIYIQPGKIDEDSLHKKNLTIYSHLKLNYGDNTLQKGVTSPLKLKANLVPLWIIIIAALVGLLIICIIIFALYECGYLRRKNKDKLKRLRRSVYRQSVRRSMVRESMRSNQRRSDDKTKLIEDSEHPPNDLAPGESVDKVTEEKDHLETAFDKNGHPEKVTEKKDDTGKVTDDKDHPKEITDKKEDSEKVTGKKDPPEKVPEDKAIANSKTIDPVEKPPFKTDEKEGCAIKNKELIIRGLQKNLNLHRSNQFLAAPISKEKLND